MSNQTKNSAASTNSSKNTGSWETPYKNGGGLTWREDKKTWEDTEEAWEDVEEATHTNQTKS